MPTRRYRSQRPLRQGPSSTAVILTVVGIGLGAGLLVLVATGGGSDEAEPAAPPPAPPKKEVAKDPHEERRDKARWWYEEQFFDFRGRAKPLTGQQVHDLFAEAEKKGYPEIPGIEWDEKKKKVYERLLDREPDDPDANRAFGRTPLSDFPDFFDVFRRIVDAKALPGEFVAFRRRFEDKVRFAPDWRTPALEPDAYRKAANLLNRYLAFEKHMAENPTERAIFEALERIKLHPILGRYDTVRVEFPPYVLFYASHLLTPENDSELEEERIGRVQERFRKRLLSFERLLSDYLAFFRREYGEALGLEEFAEDDLLFLWIFDSREAFDEYGAQMGLRNPPGLLGYFNPGDHWVFLYEDPSDRVSTEATLAHELTHQLHWHFSKVGGSSIDNHFRNLKAIWLSEGWAEYVGWCKKGADGSYSFARDAPVRMEVFRVCRELGLPIFPIQQLVQRESYAEWLKTVLMEWLPKQVKKFKDLTPNTTPQVLADLYFSMLYSESWLFVKFLHESGGGKHRERLDRFLKATLDGYRGFRGERGYARPHEAFEQIFGIEGPKDWAALQKEFDDYLEVKLYEIPPLKEK